MDAGDLGAADSGDAVAGCIVLLFLFSPLIFLLVFFFIGRMTEGMHLRRLARREEAVRGMLVTDLRRFPGDVETGKTPAMVVGEACIATDYWKSFLSSIRKIFGGEMKSYQTLVDRARREATLRMLESARTLGYNAVCNVRLDTADIGGGSMAARQVAVTIEMLATGTAYRVTEKP